MKQYEIRMNELNTHVDINILPLESRDLLIGMDWLEKHRVVLNCYDKAFTWLDDNGNTINVKGIPRKVTIREIYALQMKIFTHKGCKVFVVYVMDDKDTFNQLKIEDVSILKYFKYIFPEEVLGLPLKRDIEFTIDLVLGVVQASKFPYHMNIKYITKLKSQL